MASPTTEEELENEIQNLQIRLQTAKSHLAASKAKDGVSESLLPPPPPPPAPVLSLAPPISSPSLASTTHFLLLLADSALPLGSFAFSSGLESYQAHNPPSSSSFAAFLPSSISSYASTTLPFVLAAHRNPASLASLDDQLDAAIICTVGRRASIAQGRALLGIWEKSFLPSLAGGTTPAGALAVTTPTVYTKEAAILKEFAGLLRKSSMTATMKNAGTQDEDEGLPLASAHLAPLFGAVCAIVGLSLQQTAYVFMLNHVKALISAAIRASTFGPYQGQKILAGRGVQGMIDVAIRREWDTAVEEAGQTVPVMDLWMGRHEVLYSRIFNS